MELFLNPIKLRKFNYNDKKPLAILCNNKKIWNNLRDVVPFPYNEANAIEFIEHCNTENPTCTFAIDYNNTFIGCIGLEKQTDIYRLNAEIGYWIGEPYWGKGFASIAVKLIVDYGFNQLGLKRIYASVFDFNKPSQRVLEKSGFKLESIIEKSVIKNNIILDEYRYSLVIK